MSPFKFIEQQRTKFEADKRRVHGALRLMTGEMKAGGMLAPRFVFTVTDTGFWIVTAESLRVELRERTADALIAAVGRAYNLKEFTARLLEGNKRKARARAAGIRTR